ncbi:putative TauD/TfdA-like domain-containing protein [Seiridium cardinale]|uniref:TauD/TfdA-like domain-containing protein n=1 Tax=Seiridium cardinale TaxID=138064 RepID=A0ABR2XK05_9PEZI
MGSLDAKPSPYPESYPPFPDTGSLKAYKSIPVTPILGTEFKDVDVTEWLRAPNSDDILRDLSLLRLANHGICCSVAQRGVVFFRNQHNVDDELQKEFCRRVNEVSGAPKENGFYRHSLLAMHGADPEMGKVDPDRLKAMHLKPTNGQPRQSHVKEWHTDSSFEPAPPSYTVLRMAVLPETGGDTLWASGYELYERLSTPYKKFFESLTATHYNEGLHGYAKANPEKMYSGPRGAASNVGLEFKSHHPFVRTHPLTGWKSIFGWGANFLAVDDVTDEEAQQINDKITRLVLDNQDLQLRFHWENTGDLAIWDNRCTFHSATSDHFVVGPRMGWRCMTMGEKPFLDPKSKSRNEATGGWPYKLENPTRY